MAETSQKFAESGLTFAKSGGDVGDPPRDLTHWFFLCFTGNLTMLTDLEIEGDKRIVDA